MRYYVWKSSEFVLWVVSYLIWLGESNRFLAYSYYLLAWLTFLETFCHYMHAKAEKASKWQT